jgi:lipopolysaccharide biosynthesis protein
MEMSKRVQVINPDFKGLIHNYAEVLRFMKLKKQPPYTLFRTVMPSWDNTARRQNAGNIFVNTTLDLYQEWLTRSAQYTVENLTGDERIIFINAWNEWAEGCHLEPDKRFGDQYLKATKTVLQRFNNLV